MNRRGFTLIELIISILVVSIALIGVLSVMNLTTVKSPDPMVREQAVAIAESYMEEILLRWYDEDAVPGTIDTEGAWGPEGGESRSTYDDVNDYDGLSASEGTHNVTVNVQAATLNGVAAARVTVTVTDAGGGTLSLVGYRTNY